MFVSFPVCKLMCSGIVGLSWVYKPVVWFVPHFVYEKGVCLVLAHRENKRLLMYRNIKSQDDFILWVVCDTAKVRFFKQITTRRMQGQGAGALFAILQKCDFSSKSEVTITADLWGMVVRMAFSTCCGAWAMRRLFVWCLLSFLVEMFGVLVLFCIFALAH